MDNWAIVIGVDHYAASDSWTLRGAVRDAMAMRDWLLRSDGGNVASGHLLLLLSPCPDAPAPAADFMPAIHDNIVKAINSVLHQNGNQGNRFYFYFSGHGLSVDIDLSTKQGILASDFDRDNAHHSLTVTSIFDVFLGTRFKQQYFIIDACRNIPIDRIRLSDFPHVPEPVIPAPPQFVMFATQPRVKAMEVGFPGNESGAFTDALLKGLGGAGSAKVWDDNSQEYVVRWNELFSAVLDDVKSRKLRVEEHGPLIQEPRQYGERGDENPELRRLADVLVPDEELTIVLEPNPKVLQVASISVNALSGVAREVSPPILSLPIVVPKLRPRTYGVNGVAHGYRPAPTQAVKLYEPKTVTLKFQEMTSSPPPPSPPGLRGPSGSPEPSPQGSFPSARRAPADSGKPTSSRKNRPKGGLQVRARESLALLQVADEAGTVIATERGGIFRQDLPLGFYTLRVISPEGAVISEMIESPKPGGIREVELRVPGPESPAIAHLSGLAGFQKESDGSISPSETIGPTFFLKTSTILALAAAAQLEAGAHYGSKLRKLPLPSFRQLAGATANCGLHLVFGDEHNAGFWRSASAVDFAGIEENTLRDGGQDSPAFKSLAIGGDAGQRTLHIEWDGQQADIRCHVLPGRVTLFVITREMDGSIEVHQYMPLADSPLAALSIDVAHKVRDPQYGGSAFAAIRRIEYMQRTVAQGRISPLKPDIELLLQDKWVDPIAGCLGSYLALRTGLADGLEVATSNLVRYFGELPDSHVLRGMSLMRSGLRVEAAQSFLQAVHMGFPVFREGASLLGERALSLNLDVAIRDRFAMEALKLVAGQPWSMTIAEPRSLVSSAVRSDSNILLKS